MIKIDKFLQIFGFSAKKPVVAPFILNKLVDEQQYNECISSILNTSQLIAGTWSQYVFREALKQKNIKLVVDASDWFKIYSKEIGSYWTNSVLFDISPGTIKELERSSVINFFTFTSNKVKTGKGLFDFYSLINFIKLGIDEGVFKLQSTIAKENLSCGPTTASLQKAISLEEILTLMQPYNENTKADVNIFTEKLQELIQEEESKVLFSLSDSIAQKREKLLSSQEVKPQDSKEEFLVKTINENINNIILKNKEQVSTDFSSLIISIVNVGKDALSKNWLHLSFNEKMKLNTVFEKDLPNLMDSYMQVQTCVYTSSNQKEENCRLMQESLSLLLTEVQCLNRAAAQSQTALSQMRATTKYLKARSI